MLDIRLDENKEQARIFLIIETAGSVPVFMELVRLPMREHCCSCKILLRLQSLETKYCRSCSHSWIKAAANKLMELGVSCLFCYYDIL
jgi:hypothetical protein